MTTADTAREPRSLHTVRAWVLGAGLAGLCAGVAVGAALPVLWPGETGGVHTEVVRNFKEKYGLTREQEWKIRMVLVSRDQNLLQVYREHRSNLSQQAQFKLEQVRREVDELIEYGVLDDSQRARYRWDKSIEPKQPPK